MILFQHVHAVVISSTLLFRGSLGWSFDQFFAHNPTRSLRGGKGHHNGVDSVDAVVDTTIRMTQYSDWHLYTSNTTYLRQSIRELAKDGCFGNWPNLAQAVKIGNLMPEDAMTYVICPNSYFDLAAKEIKSDSIPIEFTSSDSTVRCGHEYEQGHAGSCVIAGGWSHFKVSGQTKNIQFIGIQFMFSESVSIIAAGGSIATASFVHCTWNSNRGDAAILVYNEKKGKDIKSNMKTKLITKPKSLSMSVDFHECVFLDNWLSNATVLNIAGNVGFGRSLFIKNVAYSGVISAVHDASVSLDSSCFFQNLIHLPGTIFISSATDSLLVEKTNCYGQNNSVQIGTCEDIFFDLSGECFLNSNCKTGVCTEVYTRSERLNFGGGNDDGVDARSAGMSACPIDLYPDADELSNPSNNDNNNNNNNNNKGNEEKAKPTEAPTVSTSDDDMIEGTNRERLEHYIDNNFMIVIISCAAFGILCCMGLVFCYGKKTAKYKELKKKAREEERRRKKYGDDDDDDDDSVDSEEESLETCTRKYKSRVQKRLKKSRSRPRTRSTSRTSSARSESIKPDKKSSRDRSVSVNPNSRETSRARSMSVNPNKKSGRDRSMSVNPNKKLSRARSMSVNPNRKLTRDRSMSVNPSKKSKSKKKEERSKSKKKRDEEDEDSDSDDSENDNDEYRKLMANSGNGVVIMGSIKPQHKKEDGEEDETLNATDGDDEVQPLSYNNMVNMIREDINFVAKTKRVKKPKSLSAAAANNRLNYYHRQASDASVGLAGSKKIDTETRRNSADNLRSSDMGKVDGASVKSSDLETRGKKSIKPSLPSRGMSRERSNIRISTEDSPAKMRSTRDLKRSSKKYSASSREVLKSSSLARAKSMKKSRSSEGAINHQNIRASSSKEKEDNTESEGGNEEIDETEITEEAYLIAAHKKKKKRKKKKKKRSSS